MMIEDYQLCEKCFEKVAKKDMESLKIWLMLCDLGIKYNDVLIATKVEIEESTKILEDLGFVVSHETDANLYLKVLGRRKDEQGIFYCPLGCYAK